MVACNHAIGHHTWSTEDAAGGLLSRLAQIVSLQEQSAAVHKEFDLCMVYLHAVQAAPISPDLSQGLPAQGAALQGLPLCLLQIRLLSLMPHAQMLL